MCLAPYLVSRIVCICVAKNELRIILIEFVIIIIYIFKALNLKQRQQDNGNTENPLSRK